MASEGAEPAAGPRLRSLSDWVDTESAAVVTVLLGVFQVVLAACFVYTTQTPPKLFILALAVGLLVIAGGSFTMANERHPSRILVLGCVCSNVLGLLAALLGFGLYCFSITHLQKEVKCFLPPDDFYYDYSSRRCPGEILRAYSWCVTLLLIIFDVGAVFLHCFLSVAAIRTLKTA